MQEAALHSSGAAQQEDSSIAPAQPVALHKPAIVPSIPANGAVIMTNSGGIPMRSAPGTPGGLTSSLTAPDYVSAAASSAAASAEKTAQLPNFAEPSMDPRYIQARAAFAASDSAAAASAAAAHNAYYSRDADASYTPHPRQYARAARRATAAFNALTGAPPSAAHATARSQLFTAGPGAVEASLDATGLAVARSAHWGRRDHVTARHTLGLSSRGGVIAATAGDQEDFARTVLTPTQRVTAAVSAMSMPGAGVRQDMGVARNPVTVGQIEAATRGLPLNTNSAGVPYPTRVVAAAAQQVRAKRAMAARAAAQGLDIVGGETVLSQSTGSQTALDRQIHAIMHN